MSVGPLRTRVILEGAPLVMDTVVLAPDREQLGLLIFPRMPECRALAGLASEAPSIDRGEITDKGSINQRAVHQHRAAPIDALYAGEHPLKVAGV